MALEFEIAPAIIGSLVYLLYRLLCVRIAPAPAARDDWSDEREVLDLTARENEINAKQIDPDEADLNANHIPGAFTDEPCAEPSPKENHEADRQPVIAHSSSHRVIVFALAVVLALLCTLAYLGFVSETRDITSSSCVSDCEAQDVTAQPIALADAFQKVGEDVDPGPGMLPPPPEDFEKQLLGGNDAALTLPLTRQKMTTTLANGAVHHKSAYWGTLHVGIPSVPYKVVFDTGSGLLILPSSYCHSETCRSHTRYRRSGSSAAKDIDQDGSEVVHGAARDQITVTFGTGEVQGVFVDELVCMSGAAQGSNYPRIDATDATPSELPPDCMRMGMVAATDMTPEPFKNFEFDGVLGLGLSGLSGAHKDFNFLDVLGRSVSAGTERPHTFAVFLASDGKETSEISFGGWDKEKYEGKLGWSQVLQPELGHWLVQISSVRVDDTVIPFCEDGKCRAVVDTGTALVSVPPMAFASIYQLLRHIDSDNSDCNGLGPELHFDLVTTSGDSFTMSLKPEDYARVDVKQSQGVSPQFTNFRERETVEPQTHCKASLMSMDMPEPIGPKLFIFGEPMLQKYYTVYDTRSPPQIGFGRVAATPKAETTLANDDDWFFED